MLFALASCGGGGSSTSTSSSSPATTSPNNSTAPAGVKIAVPVNDTSLNSPVQFSGSANSVPGVNYVAIQLDGGSTIYSAASVPTNTLSIFIPTGEHSLTLAAYNSSNAQLGAQTVSLNVTGEASPAVLSQLQNISAWQWCTATLAGKPCASGLGQATSSQESNQSSPSLSGSSTLFTLGGTEPYSNALWWISLGGGTLLSNFTYDVDFYIDNASAPEALEFDVNQSYGGLRYTWGSECSFKNTHHWDVWNPASVAWVTTSAPCPQVTSQEWHHLTWKLQRSNNQVTYVSVTLDGTTYPINISLDPQPNFSGSDLDIAFQLDGDAEQTPYKVWLDNVTLSASY